jgi:hypothetical protein
MYALAASAASVSLLALTLPAEGKIVYTPANVTLERYQAIPLDVNHDGKVDFFLFKNFTRTTFQRYSILGVCHKNPVSGSHSLFCTSSTFATDAQNQLRVSPGALFVQALHGGARIQDGDRFGGKNKPVKMGEVVYPLSSNSRYKTHWSGPWVNAGKGVKNRYLGLKFKIKGRFHFGWARLTVVTTQRSFTPTLTGYAYETIPGKGIVAGKTKGPDVTTVDPTSLGHLAAGASAIPAWRRSKQATGSTP